MTASYFKLFSMRRLVPKTLFWQLVLGTFVVQSIALALFIWYTVVSQRELADRHTRQRAQLQLSRLATACADQLARHNMAGLHDILELSRIAPTIQDARLTDLNGNTLAVSDNGRDHGLDNYELKALTTAPREQQIFKIRNGQIEAVTPVWLDDKPVALLWLEPNHSIGLNSLMIAIRIAIDYGILALLTNLLPLFLIVRSMTKPLRKLHEATKSVARNPDLQDGFALPVTTINEAGKLTASFNRMVHQLNTQRDGLLDTLALLDSMLQNAPIGFAFFDRDLRYVRLNESFAGFCQLPITEQIGRRVTEICPESIAEPMESALARVFETGAAVRNFEITGVIQDAAATRTWLMHCYPVRTRQDAVRWVGIIGVEITDRLKAEEALRKTEKLAAAGRLAASIAHEINNPLESVTNLLYILANHQPMDSAALQYVNIAQAELARVSEITQQTLRFYRQSTSPGRTNLAEVLDSVVKLYQPRISSAHVSVSTRFRDNPEIFGFTGELRQLFANLIGNALDAMPNGGRLLLRVRESNGRGPEGTWSRGVRVCVGDTGTGMSPETLHRIFEAFFTTKEITGTGLGLWVSHEIIGKHTGTVRVRSRQGKDSGTTFMLFFPNRPSPLLEPTLNGAAASPWLASAPESPTGVLLDPSLN